MTIVASTLRLLGLPACIFLGMLFFYEGVPGASRIPFLTSIPVIGDLTAGRVAIKSAEAAANARRQFVDLAEKTALAAEKAERERQQKAAAIAAEDYRRRLEAARAAEAATTDRLEQEIAAHERKLKALGRSCSVIDDADRDWLLKP
ncbi:hypothetical protein C8J36_103513 [Rhizobium sp. PP-F2F-G48]|uniref:hypothetical protein n=1 Tax=Rhizobium sp. PP-F2F-G48 TaxID=2135651 RepID=UPI00105160D9|nr:hypothetical protein [Rhizobium sp. PP-F2F-G48]TCM56143.1 hypothetical protein C8J36_103513 [Rhizobium sp. PP-F2F-G48]